MFVPVNSTTTFRCSVAEGYTLLWQVQRPGAQFPLPATSLRQFELTENSPTYSMLSVRDITEDLNGTGVFCAAVIGLEASFSEVLVIVYGKCAVQEVAIICYAQVVLYFQQIFPTNLVAILS